MPPWAIGPMFTIMNDVIYIAVTVVFFIVAGLYAAWCAKI